MLTSNSSSTTDFPWLSPADSWLNSHSVVLRCIQLSSVVFSCLPILLTLLLVKVRVTLRPAVYRQSVLLWVMSLEAHLETRLYSRGTDHAPQKTLLLYCWPRVYCGHCIAMVICATICWNWFPSALRDAPCSQMLQPTWQEGLRTEGNGANRASGHYCVICGHSPPPSESPCANIIIVWSYEFNFLVYVSINP
jgi:hypothetical protein